MKYDPIAELNRENQIRAFKPLWLPLTLLVVIPLAIVALMALGDLLDAFSNDHPILTGWILLGGSVIGLFWMFKNRLW